MSFLCTVRIVHSKAYRIGDNHDVEEEVCLERLFGAFSE